MSRASDEEILDICLQYPTVLVTFDADFHAMLARSGANQPSIIRIRLVSPVPSVVSERVQGALRIFHQEVLEGAVLSVKPRQTTCRRLPLPATVTVEI